ncbi:MAG: M2 family metallopeptidase [Gemmatimonadota bacterium]|nr:MAG: M2 family metallopeptidase [Gemmatimonadota bacterium]
MRSASIAGLLLGSLLAAACIDTAFRSAADTFLAEYEAEAQQLYYAWSEAEWASNTHIVEGDPTNAARTREAREAFVRFAGSVENIDTIRAYLSQRGRLSDLQERQFAKMLYLAAEGPMTIPEIVQQRIAAETEQVERLYGFEYRLRGRPITPNDIDALLRTSTELPERLAVWEASKEVGPALKPGALATRDLRNQTVQALGYSDFFTYQVSDYGMSADEMVRLCDDLVRALRPLYRELHTWARYELAGRYGAEVPQLLPAHWLPNRWGQDWSVLVEVEGINVDSAIGTHTAEWVMQQGEAFYVSLGFDPLPATFWERSSLYPLPPDADYKKNTHASAWHLDLDTDVRSLMSVVPNPYWYETVHHELGHVYYFMAYSNPSVPLVLRDGANRAYHEAIGSTIGLAATQPRFLVNRGLADETAEVDEIAKLLQEALNHVVFIPWSAGVMTRFERALYVDALPGEALNATWWDLVRRYQGIVPPTSRGEEYADALSKTHITDDAAQYYDYALAEALLFQLHQHVATEILGQSPYDTDYFGSAGVGAFLRDLMSPGASRPWQEVLQQTTGRELDAQAMVEYFQPLYDWLVQQNEGRTHTLPDL